MIAAYTTTTSRPVMQTRICSDFIAPDAKYLLDQEIKLSHPIKFTSFTGGDAIGGFTLIMLVYSRSDALAELIDHYIRMKNVHKMIVLWARESRPAYFWAKYGEKLTVEYAESSSLADRFRPRTEIDTLGVFSVDDDQLIHESDVDRAFDIWKGRQWALVGFNKRRYSVSTHSNMSYVYGGPGTDYHFILTNAAFMHVSYLELFNTHMPNWIRQEIDRRMNCEDLAMNLLVGDYCRCTAAFYVKPLKKIIPPRTAPKPFDKALSSRPQHYNERTRCLNSFARHFKTSLPPNNCTY